ncbi:MAG: hypothetical protein ACOYNS_02050 [Bacteroidota bacterium]
MKQAILFFALFTTLAFSQAGSTAVPFLTIPTSVEANGMGGISTTANTSSPSSMLFNPAQLGMHTQSNFLSTELNTKRTQWLPAFGHPDLWLTNNSMIFGMKFSLDDHSSISAGIGYSRLYLNLGTFIQSFYDANNISYFNGYESSDNFSAGIGLNDGYRISVGMTLKKITSKLTPFGTAQEPRNKSTGLWAADFGIIGSLPLLPYMSEVELNGFNTWAPFITLTGAYAINNIGGRVSYIDDSQSDPLPRTARLGLSLNAGISMLINNEPFTLFDLTAAREAEELLLKITANNTWDYSSSPINKINIIQDLFEGRAHGHVSARRGYSATFFESVTIRTGSMDGDGELIYNTTGYSLSTLGISKIVNASLTREEERDPFHYFLSHVEIRYNHSEYTDHPILDGTVFDTIVITFRH